MNKLLVVAALVAVLALSAEGFRVPRDAEEEEQVGTLTKIADYIRGYYNTAVDKTTGFLQEIKGMKLEEKAVNLYEETTKIISTYIGIMQDQMYHVFQQ